MNAVEFLKKEMAKIEVPCRIYENLWGDLGILYINVKHEHHVGDVEVKILDGKCVINWTKSWNETVLSALHHMEMVAIAIPILSRYEKQFPIFDQPQPLAS